MKELIDRLIEKSFLNLGKTPLTSTVAPQNPMLEHYVIKLSDAIEIVQEAYNKAIADCVDVCDKKIYQISSQNYEHIIRTKTADSIKQQLLKLKGEG